MLIRYAAAALLSLAVATRGSADEGMWTFDNPPTQRLREAYAFTPPPGWLDRIRLASVRFNDGGSGAFVSPEGLMIQPSTAEYTSEALEERVMVADPSEHLPTIHHRHHDVQDHEVRRCRFD